MSHVRQVSERLRAMPRERLLTKITRTAFGAVIIAAAIIAGRAGWPWYAVLGIGLVGAHIVSAELTNQAVRFVVAMIKDLAGAVLRRGGAGGIP